MVLQDGQDLKLLNTIEEKITLLKETGLQNLIIHPFDYEFSRLTAEAFVEDILIKNSIFKNNYWARPSIWQKQNGRHK